MVDLRVPEKKFRPEIEGVRAVAALLVAVYHIWIGSVSGGVDVFFIVSGYLITTSLLSKMEREGRINLFEYLLGLAKRLFPIAFTVLLFTTVFSILILPVTVWKQTIPEIFSSAFYFQNWQLANTAVDYLAKDNVASPFQHFWALSIQGQFYVTWPLLIMLAYFSARKIFKLPVRKTLLTVLSIVFTISLGYSIYITSANQPWAYFDTFARVWEFSLGGILALMIPYLRFKKSFSFVIGWFGLAVICFTGILLPVSNVFPGYAALLPTSGVMLVILSAENGSRFGVEKLLGSKPFLYLGNISYGFYLWHWPILIFYYTYFGTDTVTYQGGLAILLVAFALSIISVKMLEAPVRKINVKKSKVRLGGILATFMLPVIFVGISWGVYVDQSASESIKVNAGIESIEGDNVEDYPGARTISDNVKAAPNLEPIPSPINAKMDVPLFYDERDCFSSRTEKGVDKCSYGELDNPEYTIALVGGSHSGHWLPALEIVAEMQNLKIDLYNKDACRFSSDDSNGALSKSCMEWNVDVMEPLLADPPDLLFTTANVNSGDTIPAGYLSKWKEFEGITTVFALRDNPRMEEDPPMCVEKNPDDCSVQRKDALSAIPPWENTENIPDNVVFADMSEYFCDDDTCKPVIGNVLVYRDLHHITATYSRTLAPALEKHLMKALENL
ncbi:acyltransferase family protein [Paenisporosarcina sp.]|uniref:acyltransferase family protein n=1 Tax=Paenisporosarcina sp. TaxID=1932001 RepID=UPI003C79565F